MRRKLATASLEPATLTYDETAAYAFRQTGHWLRRQLQELPGFPKPDPVLRLFSKAQVDAWIAQRFGDEPSRLHDFEAELIRRARHG